MWSAYFPAVAVSTMASEMLDSLSFISPSGSGIMPEAGLHEARKARIIKSSTGMNAKRNNFINFILNLYLS